MLLMCIERGTRSVSLSGCEGFCLHAAGKVWTCFGDFWQVTLCTINLAEAEGGATVREKRYKDCSVCHTDLHCCWFQALLCAVFPYFNELPAPTPQERDEQESLHTNLTAHKPSRSWVTFAQTEYTFC